MTDSSYLLLLTHSYTPEDTAPQRRWSAFVRELVAHGYQVTVVAPQPTAKHGSWRTEIGTYGETILRVPGAQSAKTRTGRLVNNVLGSLASVPRALCAARVDLVIATVPALTTAPVGWLVAKIKRRPLLLEMRDAWPDLAHDAQLPRTLLRSSMEKVLEFTQRHAAGVVTVTEGFAEVLRKRGIRTVHCIPNGLPDEPMKVPQHAGTLCDEKLQVLYVGNHGESQGLDLIVRAAARARESVHLTMVGDGTQKERLRGLAASLAAPVTFLKPVPSEQLPELYAHCDTCVVSLRPDWPSFSWTIPSKTYELLAVGRRLTAVLQGEAARLVADHQPESIVPADPDEIAHYWRALAARPETLQIPASTLRLTEYLPANRANQLRSMIRQLTRPIVPVHPRKTTS